jgi:MoaA/NifB/PqqE/SkfB family radical SAM enzyme
MTAARPPALPSPWAARAARNDLLLNAQWEITERCNLRCAHCYLTAANRGGARAADELSFDEGVALLDQLAGLGAMFLALTGGEVLVHQRFFDLCAEARRRGFGLRVLSNGTLLGEAEARRLAALGTLSVEMTIYAGTPAGYRRATGDAGGLDAIRAAVRALRRHEVPVVLKAFYFRANADEVEEIEAFAAAEGLPLQRATGLLPRFDEGVVPLRAGLTRRQFGEVNRALGRGDERERYEDARLSRLCGRCGRARMFISASGDVSPCCSLRHVVLGNVRRRPLAAIWRDSETRRRLEDLPGEGAVAASVAAGVLDG